MKIRISHFIHDQQPYGALELKDCTWTQDVATEDSPDFVKVRAANGLGKLTGTVVEGGVTSRISSHSHHSSLVGQLHTVESVSLGDLERGYKTSIAM